jgi:hypothetical protein
MKAIVIQKCAIDLPNEIYASGGHRGACSVNTPLPKGIGGDVEDF